MYVYLMLTEKLKIHLSFDTSNLIWNKVDFKVSTNWVLGNFSQKPEGQNGRIN